MESPIQKNAFTAVADNFGELLEANGLSKGFQERLESNEVSGIAHIQEESLKPVFPAFENLTRTVNSLNGKIGTIVKRKNEEYMEEFKEEMIAIQGELKEMRKKYVEFIARPDGTDQIKELWKIISQQKAEVTKHEVSLMQKDKQIESLKHQIELQQDEIKFLNDSLTAAIRRNKLPIVKKRQLSVQKSPSPKETRNNSKLTIEEPRIEIFYEDDRQDIFKLSKLSSAQQSQDLSKVYFQTGLTTLDNFLNNLKNRDFGDKFRILKEIETFTKNLVLLCERRVHDTKKQITREKTRLESMIHTRHLDRVELAEIFEDALKRVKYSIEKRRMEGLRHVKEGEFVDKNLQEGSKLSKIDYKDFLSQDKEKLIEYFVNDEMASNIIKYLISGGDTGQRLSPPEESNRRHSHNQSVIPSKIMLDKSEDEESFVDRRNNSVHYPVIMGRNKDLLSLPKVKDRPKELSELGEEYENKTQFKLERLLGNKGMRQAAPNRLKMRDIARNYQL